jgi:hypothetical protein
MSEPDNAEDWTNDLILADIVARLRLQREEGFDVWAQLEETWKKDKDLTALINAVGICHIEQRPLPDWAFAGIMCVLRDAWMGSNNYRCGGWRLARRQALDLYRWVKVKKLRNIPSDEFKVEFGCKKNLENIRRIAAELSRAEGGPTSEESIRKSVQAVERLHKARARHLKKVG